jgi:hypothetical protein
MDGDLRAVPRADRAIHRQAELTEGASMSANPTGPEWWGEPDGSSVQPASACGFVRLLQRQLAEDAGRDGPNSLDAACTGVYLHELLTTLARLAPQVDQRTYVEFLRNRAERVARRLGPLPPWGSPNQPLELTFRGIVDALAWHAATLPGALRLDVASGFLPVPPFLELVLPVPGTDAGYVLASSDQAMTFANLLGKAWAQVLPIADDGQGPQLDLNRPGWLASVTLEAPGVQRFVELMMASSSGRPSGAPPYWPKGAWVPLAAFIRDAVEHFIVGRSMAHIMLGHVQRAPTRAIPMSGRPVKAFEFSRRQEREADAQSVRWLMTLEQFQDGWALAGWSACLYLLCRLLLEELARLNENDGRDAAGHEATPKPVADVDRLPDLQEAMLAMGPGGEDTIRLQRKLAGLTETMARHVFSMMTKAEYTV